MPAGFMAAATCSMAIAVMVRMDIITCDAAEDGTDECAPGRRTRMHVETYDTHTVPHSEKRRDIF